MPIAVKSSGVILVIVGMSYLEKTYIQDKINVMQKSLGGGANSFILAFGAKHLLQISLCFGLETKNGPSFTAYLHYNLPKNKSKRKKI